MIYANIITESYGSNLKELTNPMNIMTEYYENEINMLNSVIKYQNECSVVTESYELEALQEGFIEDTKKKIKEIIDKFVKWVKDLWGKFIALFKKKTEAVEAKVEKVEEQILRIEHSNLSKEEKEEKKQEAIKPLVKEEGKSKSEEKSASKRKYKYYHIANLFSSSFMSTIFPNAALESIEFMIEDFLKDTETIDKYLEKLEGVKRKYPVKTADTMWEEFSAKIKQKKELSPEEVVKIVKDNTDAYKKTLKSSENYKKDIDSVTKQLQKFTNSLPKDFRQENLSRLHSLVNGTESYLRSLLSASVSVINKFGTNLNPIEI